ncbi:MAG TPA: AsmA family protein [Candidatus Angelobacter sp.]|nr:AsmA family protein [Candidatus Angelobacter sp.]
MRKLGIAVLIIVVILVAAALIVPHVIDINQYHSQIQAQLEKRLGRPVTLGEMKLGLFPPSFQVNNAVIAEDPRFKSTQPFANVEKLAVSVKLLPLLKKEVEINSLELDHPHIELIRDAQGAWNFATLGQEAKPSAGATATPQPQATPSAGAQPAPPSQPAGQLTLAQLAINDGQVAVTDLQKHQSRAVYDHIDVNVTDFAPDQQFSLKVTAHLPSDKQAGSGKQAIYLQGKGGPIKQADMMNTPFDGELKLDQVSLSAAEKFLNSQGLQGIDGLLSGSATVKNAAGKLASAGNIKFDNPRIHAVDVGYPITLDYDLADDLTADVIQINKGNIKLGSTPITVAGTLNTRPTPAQLDMKVTAANASIQEAARLASAFGVAFGKGMDVRGTVNANIQARGASDKPALNGQLSARDLVISGGEVPQPVRISNIDLALTPETIRSNDFTASTGSTSVGVNFALAQYTAPNSTINAALRAGNAKIGELLNIAKAAGVSAVDGITGDGMLSLDVHAQGPTKNMSALAFNGTGKIQNASLKLPSLTKPIQIKNSDIAFSQNSANLKNLAVSLGQTNATGQVTLKNFAAPQVQFALNADKVDVTELQSLMATPAAPAKRADNGGFWQLTPQADAQTRQNTEPGIITKMTGSGTVAIGTITYNDLVLNNTHANVNLDHGVVKLNPITADVYNGKETGSITIDLRPAQPVYNVNLKTEKVDANKLISSVSDLKQTLYGLLSSNVNASFSSTSADTIARSLNGTLALNLSNGKLMKLDLLHELASVGKFLGSAVPSTPKGFTNLVSLTGNFDVKNGVAQTNNLKAVIDGGTMAATGLVNLADQSLNLKVSAVLNKALSQQVGGTQVGGFMNTALANNQGELVIPVLITGTFQHPQVAPDLQQIAQMKLQNLLPTSKDPGQLTNGILGKVLGGGSNGPIQGGATGAQGAVSGILGALGGKQQQQQPAQTQPSPATAAPTPQSQQDAIGGILGQVLNRKKKPTPTPTPQ